MMTNSQLATASLNDIVFDGRNRKYGAYQLRALYQRHVTRALVIATTIFSLLIASPIVARMLEDKMPAPVVPKTQPNPTIIELEELKIITPPPPPPPVAPQVRPPVATIRFTPPVVAPDDRVTEEVPEEKDLRDAVISTVTEKGDASATDLTPLEAVKGPEATEGVVDTKVYISVQQMPELPGGGGSAAIVAAIQRLVRYPSSALSNGVEGKVYVSFVVNAKGDVVDAKVIKGLGFGLDEETLRAINALPQFIPGKQNGQEVSVSFTVPVTYKIQ